MFNLKWFYSLLSPVDTGYGECMQEEMQLSDYPGEVTDPEDINDCGWDLEYQSTRIPKGAIIIVLVSIIALMYYAGTVEEYKDKEDENQLVPPNPTRPLPPSGSIMHFFQKAAVCADGPLCAKIGKDILLKNGSAVDSIIAAMFCNGIINMQSMGLGGGFLMTIYIRKEKKAYFLNAREVAPMKSKNRIYKNQMYKSASGPLAVGVPGELKGYWEAHQKFGKLPWNELIEPSIKLCESGYIMSKHQHLSLMKHDITDYNFREWFRYKNGSIKKPGSTVIPKRLCNTLRILARNGANDMYNGALSKMFREDIEEAGGIITDEDLREYQVEWQEPVSFNYGNKILFSSPPPGSGLLVGFILNILEGYSFTRNNLMSTQDTVITYHRIIEAFKYAFAKRGELGDPNFVNVTKILDLLNSKEYAGIIRSRIKDDVTNSDPLYYGAESYSKINHGTAHLAVLAPNGDAVSVTSTINIYFGAGITSKQTGIVLNSVMNDFSFPNSTNYYGLVGSPKNKMEPGKRPLSSMAPSILIDEKGNVKMVVGAAGGPKIVTAVAQVIMRNLWFGDNLKESVDAPRIHNQLFPMQIEYDYGTIQVIFFSNYKMEMFGHYSKNKLLNYS
nr:glutathione hydrolase 1 proenzyme-like [Leptinotarsa decemlineata]